MKGGRRERRRVGGRDGGTEVGRERWFLRGREGDAEEVEEGEIME
jgi:hypothetical protein